jgi:hypothetical protein
MCELRAERQAGRPGLFAVEREFGRLKDEYGLAPLRTRGLDRVRIHADLVMLARLGQAQAVPLAA